MNACLNCQTSTVNPKFCSVSCAAKLNNRLKPKRQKSGSCVICRTTISKRNKYCRNCISTLRVDETTVKISNLHNIRKYQRNSRIRQFARAKYLKSDLPKQCAICGYHNHFEICHKQAINSFSPDTLLSLVNSLTNLVELCPNHHWEYDNKLIELI